jgi:hypothetical protein
VKTRHEIDIAALVRIIRDQDAQITAYQIAKDNLELWLSDADGGNEPLPAQVY